MKKRPFADKGANPEGDGLPLGFGMELAEHPSAMAQFANLSPSGKAQVLAYIRTGGTGDEARHRVTEAIVQLDRGNLGFFE